LSTLLKSALAVVAAGAFVSSASAQPLRIFRGTAAAQSAKQTPTWRYSEVRSLYGPGPYGRDTPAATPNGGYRPPVPYGYAYPWANGGYPNRGPYLGWD
jgi:hypothetical protein